MIQRPEIRLEHPFQITKCRHQILTRRVDPAKSTGFLGDIEFIIEFFARLLTEKLRIGKNRVEITEQADMSEDPEEITGGWLLEIDNYEYDDQIFIRNEIRDQDCLNMTIHEPEVLSREQRSYITSFIKDTDKAIYSPNKSSKIWEKYIDMDTLARYYIVREIVDDAESFRGSSYIHKERGRDTKLMGTTNMYGKIRLMDPSG